VSYADWYLSAAFDPGDTITKAVPASACVMSETPTLTIVANRFSAASAGCPALVDAVGTFIAYHGGPPPGTQPFPLSLISVWLAGFTRADYVVESVPYTDYIPWTPFLMNGFAGTYTLVASQSTPYGGAYVYRHTSR